MLCDLSRPSDPVRKVACDMAQGRQMYLDQSLAGELLRWVGLEEWEVGSGPSCLPAHADSTQGRTYRAGGIPGQRYPRGSQRKTGQRAQWKGVGRVEIRAGGVREEP